MKKKRYLKVLSLLVMFSLLINTSVLSEARTGLNIANKTVCIGESITLKVKNASNTPKWSSSRKSVASVSSKGKVIAKKAGTAKITAKVGGNKYSCKITVPKQYIDKTSITLEIGDNKEINIYGISDNDNIVWKTSNKKVATVSDGIINGVSNGIATISGTVNKGKGKTYKCKVIVYSYESPGSKPIPDINPTQVPEQTTNPTNIPINTQTNAPVITQKPIPTSEPDNPPVSPSATPRIDDIHIPDTGMSDSFEINKTELFIPKGYKYNFTIIGYAGNVEWLSSNKDVAMVSENGEMITYEIGTTIIAAKINNHYTHCKVEVVDRVDAILEYNESNTAVIGCKNKDVATDVVIPFGIKRIENEAFYEAKKIWTVNIPDSVESIGKMAFSLCDSLKDITISNNIKEIDDFTFDNCKNLDNIVIPDGVSKIGMEAFQNCINLKSIYMSDSLESIAYEAFNSCKSLKEIIIPEGVKSVIGFTNCISLEKVKLPNSAKSINGFSYCKNLKEINIPNGVTAVGGFQGCINLKSIILPNSVDTLVDSAFFGCTSLTDVVLSSKLKHILEFTFYSCPSLKNITIPSSVENISDKAFEQCSKLVIYGVKGSYAETWAEKYYATFKEI